MTEVSFDLCRDRYVFQCTGHTGFAKRGQDILCSAVSVLCYTLLEYLENAEASQSIYGLVHDFRDGDARIEFFVSEPGDKVLEAVRAILGGFYILGENFPEYIDAII